LWDLTADNPAAAPILLTGETDIWSMTISPDSHWLVTDVGSSFQLWDLTADNPTATPILLTTGQEEGDGEATISPDSRWLVTVTQENNLVGADRTVHLWDLTADNIAPNSIALAGHLDDIWNIDFSPNSHWLVTSSQDGTVRLWDLTADDPSVSFIVLAGAGGVGSYVAISDHWFVTSNGLRPTMHLWNLRLNELIESACRIAGRNLTEAEWSQYLGRQEYRKICPDLPVHYSVVNALKEEGRILAKAGDIDGALVKLQEALAFGPTSELDPEVEAQQLAAQALVERGQELARTGDLEDVITTFQKALELNPSLELDPEQEAGRLVAQVLVREGETLAKAGEIENAAAKFQEALELDPRLELEPETKAQQLAIQALVREGETLARAGKIEDAVAKFQETLEVDPSQEIDPETKAREVVASHIQDIIERGQDLAKSGDIEGAIAKFQEALELDPSLELDPEKEARKFAGWELYIKGSDLAERGEIEEAIAAYSEAQAILDLVPLIVPAKSWNTLCRYGSLSGYASDVMYACTKAVEQAVKFAEEQEIGLHRDSRGLARALTGDYAGALEDFKFFLEWSENEEHRRQRQAWISEMEAGRNPFDAESLEELKTRELAADQAQVLVWQGQNLAKSGDIEDAVAKFQEALELDPSLEIEPEVEARQLAADQAQVLVWQGQNLAKSGDIEGAMATFQEALELDPSLELEPEREARKLAGKELYVKGHYLAKQGEIEEAVAAYSEAQTILDPVRLIVPGVLWNTLCRYGSLWGYASDVMHACTEAVEQAVKFAQEEEIGLHRDSRGLARTLTEDYARAIEDFNFFVEWSKENGQNEEDVLQREAWIAELEAGRNPFDAETLKALRNE